MNASDKNEMFLLSLCVLYTPASWTKLARKWKLRVVITVTAKDSSHEHGAYKALMEQNQLFLRFTICFISQTTFKWIQLNVKIKLYWEPGTDLG